MRLGKRTRKAFLVVHVASAGAWIGMDIVLGVLVVTGLVTGSAQAAGLAFQALALFAVWPLVITGLVCLLSGVVLGIGSKYGLVGYWWVAVKLVMNVVLVLLVIFALRPGVTEAARYGLDLTGGDLAGPAPTGLLFPPIVSTAALIAATVLSVYKPWGRVRRAA